METNTIEYAGVLFLIRGLPGAGKTSLATHIWSSGVICEADKFFYDKDGNYNFDPQKLREAHMWCIGQVEDMMIKHQLVNQYYSEIVVSNTFTQEWEMEPYFELAQRYRYKVVSIIVENRHGSQNIHGVSEEKLEIMRQRFDIKL